MSHSLRWAKNSKVREQICEKCLSPEEKERRMREIFGLAPKEKNGDAVEVLAHAQFFPTESNQIKPVVVVDA